MGAGQLEWWKLFHKFYGKIKHGNQTTKQLWYYVVFRGDCFASTMRFHYAKISLCGQKVVSKKLNRCFNLISASTLAGFDLWMMDICLISKHHPTKGYHPSPHFGYPPNLAWCSQPLGRHFIPFIPVPSARASQTFLSWSGATQRTSQFGYIARAQERKSSEWSLEQDSVDFLLDLFGDSNTVICSERWFEQC